MDYKCTRLRVYPISVSCVKGVAIERDYEENKGKVFLWNRRLFVLRFKISFKLCGKRLIINKVNDQLAISSLPLDCLMLLLQIDGYPRTLRGVLPLKSAFSDQSRSISDVVVAFPKISC